MTKKRLLGVVLGVTLAANAVLWAQILYDLRTDSGVLLAEGRELEERSTEEVTSGGIQHVNDRWIDWRITSDAYPIRVFRQTQLRRNMEFISCDEIPHPAGEGVRIKDVLAEAARRGLRRPIYEDALYVPELGPGLEKQLLIFLSEPHGEFIEVFVSGSGFRLETDVAVGPDEKVRYACEKSSIRYELYRFAFVKGATK